MFKGENVILIVVKVKKKEKKNKDGAYISTIIWSNFREKKIWIEILI